MDKSSESIYSQNMIINEFNNRMIQSDMHTILSVTHFGNCHFLNPYTHFGFFSILIYLHMEGVELFMSNLIYYEYLHSQHSF